MPSIRFPSDINNTDTTTILVPIRYPLTDKSVQTLRHAADIAAEEASTELLVLHVNLLQNDARTRRTEIRRAIDPIVRETDVSLLLQNAFLIEEAITKEALSVDADYIVIGKNQNSRWRHFLSRLVGNDPDISTYLQEHTDATIDVVG